MFADESNTGRAEPAYDAHMLPIGEWSLAVWEEWRTLESMHAMIRRASAKLAKAKNPWNVAYGPAAAFCPHMLAAAVEAIAALWQRALANLRVSSQPQQHVLQQFVDRGLL